MDIRKVKKLIELVENSDVSEIEIADGEETIRIKRSNGFVAAPIFQQAPPLPVAPVAIKETVVEDNEPLGDVIKSPMVGTFYLSSGPGQEPFIKVGDNINAGDTVCIIEAMKIMNQITSDYSGKVIKILTENAQPVEYDQPLFVVE